MRRRGFLLLTLVLLATPALAQERPVGVTTVKDLTYGKVGDVELKLDMVLPPTGNGPYPAVVCLHGGGWRGGHRTDLSKPLKQYEGLSFIEMFATKGFVAVSVSYRLVPQAASPAQVEDCKAAVRWLRANAKKYKLNPDQIGAMGFSAGGHLACLLGTADARDGLEGDGGNAEQSSRVQAVVNFFGPTDFTRKDWSKELEDRILVPFLGGTLESKPDNYKKASPVTYATRDDPPFLFFHGTKDPLVPVTQPQILADRLKAVGVEAKVVIFEGEGHGWGGEKLTQSIDQTVALFKEKLK